MNRPETAELFQYFAELGEWRIMPVYEYIALDGAGKNVNGIIDADSAVAARQRLRGTGIFPVEVKETSSRPTRGLPPAQSPSPICLNASQAESFQPRLDSYRSSWGPAYRSLGPWMP